MNIDAADSFDIDQPPIDKIPLEPIGDLQPQDVYTSALANLPQQKMNDYKIRSAEKTVLAAKGALYPSYLHSEALATTMGIRELLISTQIPNGYKSSGLVLTDALGNVLGNYECTATCVYQWTEKIYYFTGVRNPA